MVRGTTEVDASVNGDTSKALVFEYTKQVLQQRDYAKLNAFVAETIVQHAPLIAVAATALPRGSLPMMLAATR